MIKYTKKYIVNICNLFNENNIPICLLKLCLQSDEQNKNVQVDYTNQTNCSGFNNYGKLIKNNSGNLNKTMIIFFKLMSFRLQFHAIKYSDQFTASTNLFVSLRNIQF